MYEIIDMAEKVSSVALLVGTGACNARCKHCAGIMHRAGAPRKDGVVDQKLVTTVLKKCYINGARSLSISSSGEPTVSPQSVTKILEIADTIRGEGVDYPSVHLYSNGIRIGESEAFAQRYLPLWRNLGLKELYITVHDVDLTKNAKIYGVKKYPNLATIVDRIHTASLTVRANVMLAKTAVGTLEAFVATVAVLQAMGFNAVSAWPVRGDNDQIDRSKAPEEAELEKMATWAAAHTTSDAPIRLLLEKEHTAYKTGQKLTLFPDGTVSNRWCR